MNGLMENATYTFDLPGLNWGFSTSEPWGLWVALAWTVAMVGGPLFCALKGKYGFLLLTVLIPGVGLALAIVGGIRLAKPRSFWARHMYDRKLMRQAISRFEPRINLDDYPEAKLRKGFQRPLNTPPADHAR